MRFWDSSAVIPLLFQEPASGKLQRMLATDRQMHVWWATELECISAIARREREGLASRSVSAALERLSQFREDWSEVLPSAAVRETARRLLRVHPLRTCDSLQLAAALTDTGHRAAPLEAIAERPGQGVFAQCNGVEVALRRPERASLRRRKLNTGGIRAGAAAGRRRPPLRRGLLLGPCGGAHRGAPARGGGAGAGEVISRS